MATPDGGWLRFRWRPGAPPTIVAPLSCWLAEAIETALPGRAVLTYDPRGRGESAPAADASQMTIDAAMADLDWVSALVREEPIVGIGWSYEAAVLAHFAARRPERVTRLLLVAPLPLVRDPAMSLAAAHLSTWPATLAMPASLPPDQEDAFWRIQAVPGPAHQFVNEEPRRLRRTLGRLYRELGPWNWRSAAQELAMPTLVVHGGRDAVAVESAREWVLLGADSRLLVLTAATRYPWLECPGHFAALAAHFLR